MKDLTILTASDLHFGKPQWREGPQRTAHKLAIIADAIDPDVFYFGGDLAEQKIGDFEIGLAAIASIKARHKVFVLGNNDLEQLTLARRCRPHVGAHYDWFREKLSAYGIQLLDHAPYRVGDVAFAGSVGWFDGSLWNPDEAFRSQYSDYTRLIEDEVSAYLQKHHFSAQLSSAQFYAQTEARLASQLDALDEDPAVKAIVLGIHFLPDPQFVLRTNDTAYDFPNYFMGGTSLAHHYQRPKVLLGLTGHTHRSETFSVGRANIHNVSGPDQPHAFRLIQGTIGYRTQKIDVQAILNHQRTRRRY